MADEILFAGGGFESLSVVGGSCTEVTTTTYIDTNYSDKSINVPYVSGRVRHFLYSAASDVLSPAEIVSGETLFVHFRSYTQSVPSSTARHIIVGFYDHLGYPWLALARKDSSLMAMYYNTGTGPSPVWTEIGTGFTFTSYVGEELDLELTLGSPHAIKLYRGGSLVSSATFTQASFTKVANIQYGAFGGGSGSWLSQFLATRGISTIGAKVKTIRATGAGANTGWTSSYTSVNEAVGNDDTVQSAATAGLKSTHAMGDVTVAAGFEIKSVFHWLRAKNDGTSPTKIRSLLRMSGVDYSTGDLPNLGLSYGPVGARYDTDPLGGNWTQTSWNAIEAGYESAA